MTFEQSKSTSPISLVCARTLRDTAMMLQALARSGDDLARWHLLWGVSALAQPHFLVEVEGVAVID